MQFISNGDTDTILFCTCVSQNSTDFQYTSWHLLSVIGRYIANCPSDRGREGGCGIWEWSKPGSGEHHWVTVSMVHA